VLTTYPEREEFMTKVKQRPFPADLHIRIPKVLTGAIKCAADKNMTTSSEYIRQAIIARLKSENSTSVELRAAV
jgi:hypothetical protein